ncbi:hypothetical protein Tco_0299044 [Tanacetum coccineum]
MNKMRDEYFHCISFRASQLPITKFSYRVYKSTKIASMRITRNNQPLNYRVYEDFTVKMLGFIEWLELHHLASKKKGASCDQLLKNLKAKFKWIDSTADKLGIPPPPQLTDSKLPPAKMKRKRRVEMVKEVFISDDLVVEGMRRNLALP